MFTIMHISDLHRSKMHPVTNNELISCLATDLNRYHTEQRPIATPNAVVVSGDLVTGLPRGSREYPNGLKNQYEEALGFLERLTEAFFDGDRSRVIIVPGNHDVDWNKGELSMSPAAAEPGGLPDVLSQPDTPYRWSWSELRLLRITNRQLYEERFAYFRELYDCFYQSIPLAFAVDSKRDWNNFELDEGRILVTAFNSCSESDCFNSVGYIPSRAIAESHLEALRYSYLLRVAAWHHDLKGNPLRSDYLDPDTVLAMIDKGYRLGMHGHRHKSDVSPTTFRLSSGRDTMCVSGTGSLCSDYKQLPSGVNRQYNIVEIDSNYCKARIHVREMRLAGVFGPGRLIELDGNSYADVEWTVAPENMLVSTRRDGGRKVEMADKVEVLISNEKFDDAISTLKSSRVQLGSYGRKLLIEALWGAKKWAILEQEIGVPTNPDELTKAAMALVALKEWGKVEHLLQNAANSEGFSVLLLNELSNRVKAEKRMHDEHK